MASDYKFVDTVRELAESTLEFFSKQNYWVPKTLGGNAKYFVHLRVNGRHVFGLSKFCAFKNISVSQYIGDYRYRIGGGTTQRHIASLTRSKWQRRQSVSAEIREAFDEWIVKIYPNYTVAKASFITIETKGPTRPKPKKLITPEQLEKQLRHQRKVGRVGEEIALKFEEERLRLQGITNPRKFIDPVFKKNSAEGFDIRTITQSEIRFIEVKASCHKGTQFFISENERSTLAELKDKGYLYLVHITDLVSKRGIVTPVVDPIRKLKTIKPIAYRVEISEA